MTRAAHTVVRSACTYICKYEHRGCGFVEQLEVGLAAAIRALRAELAQATSHGAGQPVHMRVDPVELTVHAAVTRQYNGKIEWSVLGLNGAPKPANTHTLTLRLTPAWKTVEGAPVSDCAVESKGSVGSTFGPQPIPPTSEETIGSQQSPVPSSVNHLGLLMATRWQPPDLPSARTWWEKAAEAGDPEAMNSLANLLATLWQPRDLSSALAWYLRAAQAGNTEAMNNLGLLLATQWQPPDLPTARTWWEKAAEAGHVEAMYNLANLLASLGERRLLSNARAWWEKAAEAGHPEAMCNLAVLFATQWEPRDLPTAHTWWEKAAKARCRRSHITM